MDWDSNTPSDYSLDNGLVRRVVVVGGGIIGGSIAWRLAQAGCRVSLCEAGRFGGEASSAGAGMLALGSEFQASTDTPSIWTELAQQSMARYPGFVDELRAESGQPIDFEICGSQCGEMFYPGDGYVDPRDVIRALRSVCESAGVLIQEKTPVAELDTGDETAVVVAAGAWSSGIVLRHGAGTISLPESLPVKGHLIAYRIRPGLLGPIRRSGHTYVLQRASGLVVAGSTEEYVGFDRKVDSRICDRLHKRAVRLWPDLSGKLFDLGWIGFRPATANGLPALGRLPGTNVWLAYGHFRNGILLAPATAAKIAEEICAER